VILFSNGPRNPFDWNDKRQSPATFQSMSNRAINFEVQASEGEARAALLKTRRGIIETPVFMPLATAGSVKGIRFEHLESDLDARIILGNTYHLWLRPGIEVIKACGGLHKFIGWDRAMLTDSGGFQVWSLTEIRKVTEEGAEFRSHIDGALCFLSPEISMEVQAALGSEIAMVFDECPPGEAAREDARRSMELTVRWARRSKEAFALAQAAGLRIASAETEAEKEVAQAGSLGYQQALFGIVQGASYLDLRRESLERTIEIGFDGYAIGGLSVGEEKPVMLEIIEDIAPRMPADRPRYLMGVGTPEDLIEAVARGVDMFDCVLPTRNGRNGQAFTSRGKLNIKNARFATDTRPLDEDCSCSVCRRHSRAFIRHLYLAGEMLAGILLTHHNLAFFLDTMRHVRQAIRSAQFAKFRRQFTERLSSGWE
jgi:queuine tRNA-ribosyltransferase